MYQFPRWERGFKSISLLIEIVVFLFEKQKKKRFCFATIATQPRSKKSRKNLKHYSYERKCSRFLTFANIKEKEKEERINKIKSSEKHKRIPR